MSSSPRVPLNPQPLAALQARYLAAVADVIPQRDVVDGRHPVPSGQPEHVFDTENGLRLIVSTEQLYDGRVGVHLSASRHSEAAFVSYSTPQFLDAVRRQWQQLAQSSRYPVLIDWNCGIPHFFIERGN